MSEYAHFPWLVSERDHELQNPISAEKIRLLGEYLRLTPESRVLDIASGKGGPARLLASTFGCRIRGIEQRPEFAEESRRLAAERGLDALIEVETADAAEALFEPASFDAALCIGAAFVWGTIADAAAVLREAVPPGGSVAVGEPYSREDGGREEGFVDFPATVARFEDAGLRLTGVISASEDDWDRYESLHWRAFEEHLAAHPDAELRALHEGFRTRYVTRRRGRLGWAIFVGRRP